MLAKKLVSPKDGKEEKHKRQAILFFPILLVALLPFPSRVLEQIRTDARRGSGRIWMEVNEAEAPSLLPQESGEDRKQPHYPNTTLHCSFHWGVKSFTGVLIVHWYQNVRYLIFCRSTSFCSEDTLGQGSPFTSVHSRVINSALHLLKQGISTDREKKQGSGLSVLIDCLLPMQRSTCLTCIWSIHNISLKFKALSILKKKNSSS